MQEDYSQSVESIRIPLGQVVLQCLSNGSLENKARIRVRGKEGSRPEPSRSSLRNRRRSRSISSLSTALVFSSAIVGTYNLRRRPCCRGVVSCVGPFVESEYSVVW